LRRDQEQVTTVIAAVALLAAIGANIKEREGWAFIGASVTTASAVATYFLMLYPDVMPTTLAGGTSLTIENASSSELTLKIMTVAALVFTPVVLLYTAWTYWTFRRRLSTKNIPEPVAVR